MASAAHDASGPVRPPIARRLALTALLPVLLACAPQRVIRFADRPPLLPGDAPLVYASSGVTAFADRRGRPCPVSSGHAAHGVVGWQSPDDDPLCVLDTVAGGPAAPTLELRWQVTVPESGDLALLARRQAAGAWGAVEARGSYFGQFYAVAELVLEASAPSCRAAATLPLARAEVTGPWNRPAAFAGWIELPDLALQGCVAGEVLELRLRLAGRVNRGRIEVDGFGAAAGSDVEAAKAFVLRRRDPAAPPPAAPAQAQPTVVSPTPHP
jgi:hypothetical protein